MFVSLFISIIATKFKKEFTSLLIWSLCWSNRREKNHREDITLLSILFRGESVEIIGMIFDSSSLCSASPRLIIDENETAPVRLVMSKCLICHQLFDQHGKDEVDSQPSRKALIYFSQTRPVYWWKARKDCVVNIAMVDIGCWCDHERWKCLIEPFLFRKAFDGKDFLWTNNSDGQKEESDKGCCALSGRCNQFVFF